jgi:tetratricopeptide (TPR) repeat protein
MEQKVVLRAAAVAGATFNSEYLPSLVAAEIEPGAAGEAMDALEHGEFVVERQGDGVSHAFAHVLTQEVVYSTLPFARRRELHRSVGLEIERDAQGRMDAMCGVLLHHFDRAGDAPRTRTYATMTGDRAAGVFANREAIAQYQRAIEAAQRGRGNAAADRSMLLERIGDCLDVDGRHGAAAEAYRDALEVWRGRGRRAPSIPQRTPGPLAAREAALARKIAVAFERNSEYDQSLTWLDRADALLPPRATALRSEVLASRSMALFRKGEYRTAIESGRDAVRIARRTRDPRRIAYAQNMLANSYIEEGLLRQAIRHLLPAVDLYQRIDDVYGQAAANNNLGNCYQALGDLPAALRHYAVALRADGRMGKNGAIIHNNMGEVLLMMGDAAEAATHLEQVVRANASDANLNAVAGLSEVNLSRCRVLEGDLVAAEQHLGRGMKLLRGVGARGLLAEARLQSGELRLAQGRAQLALREALAALDEAKALNARLLEASAERLVALAYAAMGNHDAAWTHGALSVTLATQAHAEHERARSAIVLARIAVAAGRRVPPSVMIGLRRATSVLDRMDARRELAAAEQLLREIEEPGAVSA